MTAPQISAQRLLDLRQQRHAYGLIAAQ